MARKVLTASVAVGQRGRVAFARPQDGNSDELAIANFYQANDVKPEELAATVSRVFLGVKLECAQCHDHPFAPYTKDQFWQFAAFFGEFTPLPPVSPSFVGPLPPQYESNRLTIPNTTKTVTALYFDGNVPDWSSDRTPRRELAGWLTAAENPYFARNLANRTWAHFFGIGIVEPVDEPGAENPPSHPELLDELTAGADRGEVRPTSPHPRHRREQSLQPVQQADARDAVRPATVRPDAAAGSDGRPDLRQLPGLDRGPRPGPAEPAVLQPPGREAAATPSATSSRWRR